MTDNSLQDSSAGFMPEHEEMDLSELYDKQFIVSVNTGHRDDGGFLCRMVHGLFDFDEMVGEITRLFQEGHNAKAVIINKDVKEKPKFLDAKTTDYIQSRAIDILMDRLLSSDKDYTCKATILEAREQEIPKEG